MQIGLLGFGDVIRHGSLFLDFLSLIYYKCWLFKRTGVIELEKKIKIRLRVYCFTSKIKTVNSFIIHIDP